MTDATATGADARPLIELHGLHKRYGAVHALDDLTLELPRGAVGLLGPNGAGKTSLLKVLLGLTPPSGGRARIVGFDPRLPRDRIALRRRIGYMPESDCLIPSMNAVELVSTLGRVSGLGERDAMTRAHEVLDYVGLEEERYRDSDGFSTGMKQRLKLAQALVHDPDVLLLDEPTNGLDPRGRREMLALVHDLGRNLGKDVLLCSHLLPDVERTCEHVVVLRRGRVHLQGRIEELTAAQGRTVTVRVARDRERLAALVTSRGGSARELDHDSLRLERPPEAGDLDDVFALAAECGVVLTAAEPARSTLEDVFLSSLAGESGGRA